MTLSELKLGDKVKSKNYGEDPLYVIGLTIPGIVYLTHSRVEDINVFRVPDCEDILQDNPNNLNKYD